MPGSAQPRDGGLQHAIDGGLAAAGGTDEHRPEAHVERLVHLHHLRHDLIHRLQIVLFQRLDDRLGQVTLLHLRDDDAREQIGDDVLEELRVLRQKLGKVRVPHGANEHHLLVQVRGPALEGPRHDEHGLERTHAEIVVVLLRELLGGELVQLDHLSGEVLGRLETLREEHHLRHQRVIRDHHRHRAEQRLEVIRQLRATGVARVHGDEHGEGVHQLHVPPLKVEFGHAALHRVLNCQQLLRDDREHLDVDAVELIEARPSTALSETGEEFPHELVVEVIAAVEHHALHPERLSEILC